MWKRKVTLSNSVQVKNLSFSRKWFFGKWKFMLPLLDDKYKWHTVSYFSLKWKVQLLKSKTLRWEERIMKATKVTLHLNMWVLWRHIWKFTQAKKHTNVTNATIQLLSSAQQAIWGDTWKYTKKNQRNAMNVTIHPVGQTIWRHIWKHTVEKRKKNAINVGLPWLKRHQRCW